MTGGRRARRSGPSSAPTPRAASRASRNAGSARTSTPAPPARTLHAELNEVCATLRANAAFLVVPTALGHRVRREGAADEGEAGHRRGERGHRSACSGPWPRCSPADAGVAVVQPDQNPVIVMSPSGTYQRAASRRSWRQPPPVAEQQRPRENVIDPGWSSGPRARPCGRRRPPHRRSPSSAGSHRSSGGAGRELVGSEPPRSVTHGAVVARASSSRSDTPSSSSSTAAAALRLLAAADHGHDDHSLPETPSELTVTTKLDGSPTRLTLGPVRFDQDRLKRGRRVMTRLVRGADGRMWTVHSRIEWRNP